MWLVFPCYLLVTPGYLIVTSGYLVTTSGCLVVVTGYFSTSGYLSLVLVPCSSNNVHVTLRLNAYFYWKAGTIIETRSFWNSSFEILQINTVNFYFLKIGVYKC